MNNTAKVAGRSTAVAEELSQFGSTELIAKKQKNLGNQEGLGALHLTERCG